MTQITLQDGKVVMRDGKVGTEQECCCSGGVCCLPDGTCVTDYASKEACEECSPAYMCVDQETFEASPVADCSECGGFCYESGNTGPCGTWRPNKNCDTANCNCENFGEEVLLARDCFEFSDIADVEALRQHLEDSCGFANVRYEFEPETGFYAFYGSCCTPTGGFVVVGGCGWNFCGTAYDGIRCEPSPFP